MANVRAFRVDIAWMPGYFCIMPGVSAGKVRYRIFIDLLDLYPKDMVSFKDIIIHRAPKYDNAAIMEWEKPFPGCLGWKDNNTNKSFGCCDSK